MNASEKKQLEALLKDAMLGITTDGDSEVGSSDVLFGLSQGGQNGRSERRGFALRQLATEATHAFVHRYGLARQLEDACMDRKTVAIFPTAPNGTRNIEVAYEYPAHMACRTCGGMHGSRSTTGKGKAGFCAASWFAARGSAAVVQTLNLKAYLKSHVILQLGFKSEVEIPAILQLGSEPFVPRLHHDATGVYWYQFNLSNSCANRGKDCKPHYFDCQCWIRPGHPFPAPKAASK